MFPAKWKSDYLPSEQCLYESVYFAYYRVTIVKDKDTRRSKGVAFVLFLDRESARNCVRAINNKQVRIVYSKALSSTITGMLWKNLSFIFFSKITFSHQLFGRTVKASIAIDNGRATEFIRRRNYTDKSKCYECGVCARLSIKSVKVVRCRKMKVYHCVFWISCQYRIQVIWATRALKIS